MTLTPKKILFEFKDGKTDSSFCAICSTDTSNDKNRRVLFDSKNSKTSFCESVEEFIKVKLTLEKDSRVACRNCTKHLQIAIKKSEEFRLQHDQTREKYKERVNIRVKRGRRVAGASPHLSVRERIANYELLTNTGNAVKCANIVGAVTVSTVYIM